MRGLGELESVVMDRVWDRPGRTTVREILEELQQSRKIAYTTVMTTMDNLYRKGWLDRQRHGKAFQYWPTLSREGYSARLMRDTLEDSENPDMVLTHFLEQMSDEESARLQDVMRRWASGRDAR